MISIQCENVSIRYLIGDLKNIGIKEYIVRRIKNDYHVKEFWADRDITFSLEQGDMLGIIGSNGAGKSTLLKAVSGVMVPTGGSLYTNGKIAALLELTSGFDPDLTVRENTYLRGALLGYTKKFMDEKYEEIIAFAELENNQESYFKQLSSGMKSRLAFSIACLVNPDILILDEVLSVGDGSFQKKSADKMREILKSGLTGVLVSHSIPQIRELCNKILWLDRGRQIAFTDEVETYCDAYEEFQITRNLPETHDEVLSMADAYQERIREEQAERARNQLKSSLSTVDDDTALKEAIQIIQQKHPEFINREAAKDYLNSI